MSIRQHHFDTLETRICMSTYTVTNGLESDFGSFRQAILSANAHPGLDTIDFNVPIPGLKVYAPASRLPTITDPVVIDGTTQPGWSPGRPVIELRGSGLGVGDAAIALEITGGNSTVRGLIFTRWDRGAGSNTLWLHNGDNNVVEGCWFGIDGLTGNAAALNNDDIVMTNSSNNRIGGLTAQTRNVISGARGAGIFINGDSDSNTIQGNYIGTNASGRAAVGNLLGIVMRSTGNTIGGLSPASRNVISGNREGLYVANYLEAGTSDNLVQGNYIGTDVDGTRALGNRDYGIVVVAGSHDNLIGGLTPEARNVISANGTGIYFNRDPDDYTAVPADHDNAVQGNYIGLDFTGRPLGNTGNGVYISNVSNTLIGGTTPAARNVISANGAHGVLIEATSITLDDGTVVPGTATANLVQGNYIGLRPDGFDDEGNALNGVHISGNVTGNGGGNTVGGAAIGAGNVISGNRGDGLRIDEAPANTVQGNLIGLDASGAHAIPNGGVGISVGGPNTLIGGSVVGTGNVVSGNDNVGILLALHSDGSRLLGNRVGTDITGLLARPNALHGVFVGSDHNLIGGPAPAERNLISGNASTGLFISGNLNFVRGNYIGTSPTGDSALPNMFGIYIQGGDNTLGGSAPGEANLVSGNTEVGITFATTNANDNYVVGNLIGTDLTGNAALPNLDDGIQLLNGVRNQIGGFTPDYANVISANRGYGIRIDGNASDNQVEGNIIGVGRSGDLPLGNLYAGVGIGGSSLSPNNNNNRIGGNEAGAGNTIAYNGAAGVEVRFGARNGVYGNRFFANRLMPIDLGADGPTANDSLDSDTGPNALQNYPQITAAYVTTSQTVVKGTLNSTARSVFSIDVYASPTADADPTGRGEGRIYLGYFFVATDATGNVDWSHSFTTSVPPGYILSATATGDRGTSEFSPNVVVGDQLPPTVSANFDVTLGPDHRVSFTFSENVNGSFGPADVTLRNLTTGAVIPIHHTSYGLASNRADAFVSGILPDGNYRVTLNAFGITDAAGNPLDGNADGSGGDDYTYDFFFLNGDVDRDRDVDFADLVTLAQKYGVSGPGVDWYTGDFTYDSTVNFNDLVILAQHYGTTLPVPAAPAHAPAPAPVVAAALDLRTVSPSFSAFSTRRIVGQLANPTARTVTRPQKPIAKTRHPFHA
jgi:titin